MNTNSTEKELTGYPSIDKPWLKFYDKNIVIKELPKHNLYDNIYLNNKDHLNDIALHYFGRDITYGELFSGINKAERKLLNIGVKKGDIVSFVSIFTPEIIYAFYALNRIGAVCSFLDPRSSKESLINNISKAESKVVIVLDACTDNVDTILEDSRIEHIVLVSTSKYMGSPIKQLYNIKQLTKKKNFNGNNPKIVKWNNLNCSKEMEYLPKRDTNPADLPAAIFYTGGTTGESKGVLLSNYNINSPVEQLRKLTGGFNRGESWLSPSVPFIAYFTIASIHSPLSFGMKCYIQLYDVKAMAKTILKKHISHIAASPILYEELLKTAKSNDLSYIIMPTTGADKISEKRYHEINDFFHSHKCSWNICNGYGMTEVGSAVCVCYKGNTNKANSVGIPFPNTIISSFNPETNDECKVGETGEICISGPSVMMGYFKNPEKTDEVIKIHSDGKRWMHTGDLGYIDEDGCVFIIGRIKRMITKYDGFKVFPSLVEEKILKCPLIENCSCVAMNDREHGVGQVPVVFVVVKSNEPDKNAIEKQLAEISANQLPDYSRPIKYFFIEQLPLTHAGKVDYRKLEQMLEE